MKQTKSNYLNPSPQSNERLIPILENLTSQQLDQIVTFDKEEGSQRTGFKTTWFHEAAKRGLLGRIQKELLTQEALTKPDSKKETPIYLAIDFGNVNNIGFELLTDPEIMTQTQGEEGITALHALADTLLNEGKEEPPHFVRWHSLPD